jgi:hypothetical protein
MHDKYYYVTLINNEAGASVSGVVSGACPIEATLRATREFRFRLLDLTGTEANEVRWCASNERFDTYEQIRQHGSDESAALKRYTV